MKESYGPSPFCHPFFSMMGGHSDHALIHAVSRKLLSVRHAKLRELKDQCNAKDDRLRDLRYQFDAMKGSVEAKLPELLKPVARKLGFPKLSAWDVRVYDFNKDKQVVFVELKHKADKQQYKQVEIPMPDDLKANCVERAKVMAERDAIEKQRGVVGTGIDVATEKLESELYDLATQQQAEQFIAKLDKKALAKLKAIAAA